VSTKSVIFKFRFGGGAPSPPLVRPCFPLRFCMCCVWLSTKAAIRSVNSSLVGHCEAGTEFLCIIFVYNLETVTRRADIQAYLCTHLEHSSFTTCTQRHTVCANRTTILRQLLTTRCMRCPVGRCHAVEGRTGVCLSEAQRISFLPGANIIITPPVSYRSDPGRSMWVFWWMKWQWDRFLPCQLLFHQCYIHL
jgi:hypothetical protein